MEEMADLFNYVMKITKSHIPTANIIARITIEEDPTAEHQARSK
jgi:hypothetical protein